MYNCSYKNTILNTITSYKSNIYNIIVNDNQKTHLFFLFIESGLCIFEKKLELNNINEEEYNNLKILLKNISIKLLNKNKNPDLFIFNRFLLNKYKIVILLKSKLAFVGIFTSNSSKGFQNLLLMHLYISLINFKGDSINKINSLNKYLTNIKNDYNIFYNLQQFTEENKEKIDENVFKNISNIDLLELSIYDKYFLKYCILHFEKVFQFLIKREDIDLTYTKFLNLYIIDINSDQLLFDLGKIQNIQNIKYYNNKNIFDEIIFHSHQLYEAYTEKYNMKFIKNDSSHRFVKFECTSTYPRILFIIRFVPILKGIIIVHIYYQKKLSRHSNNNNSTLNNENRYKEVDLVFGSFLNENGGIDLKYVMPKKLTEIEAFCEEFYVTTRNCDMFKLNDPKKEFKYFNYNIINIINTMPIDVVNDNLQKIFEYINEKIKNKFIEEENKNINKKNNDKNIINDNNNNDSRNKNEILEKIFNIDKNAIYKDLFENNYTDRNIMSIPIEKNNFSTINTNQNIIKILRESDPSLNNHNIMKHKNSNQIKEDKSFPNEIKTITLMSESNLLSKEDDCSKNIIIDDFSHVSEIKKNENSKIRSKYIKKDNNINIKKMKFSDLLNSSSSKNPFSSLHNIKEKSKIIEESESDMNKENSKNLIIKNDDENRSKIRNKLKLFDQDPEYPI